MAFSTPMFKVGDRVALVHCADEYTRLRPGEVGTVSFVDSVGTVHVDWDSGSTLGMVAEAGDRIRKVEADGGSTAEQPGGSK